MKSQKYILHSVAVLAVAALATACSSEDELTDKTSGSKETVTITAYQPNTRVGFDSAGNGYWQAGDEIGVWSTGENKFSPFTIETGAGEASATFSGTVTDGMGQYAVYPYNENHKLSGSSLTYYLPSSYTYTSVDQTFLPTEKNGNSFCMPMYGTIENNDVSFMHLGGVICLKIDKMPAESGTVKVIEATNQLCGSFKANLTDGTPEIQTAQATSENSVTFTYSGATVNAAGVLYLPVATGTYNLTVQVYDGNKVSTTKTSADVKQSSLKVVNIKTDYTDNSNSINGHKFIDLGLPSGLLWAETNIGATTAADDGDYYAWGETSPKEEYSLDNYAHYDTSTSSYTKYNSTDGKTELDKTDDAAYVNWGTSCRMPTYSDFKELYNRENCTWTSTRMKTSSENSIYGYKVTSKKNGNSIFLPASGSRGESDLGPHGSDGYCWSSTLNNEHENGSSVYCLHFGGDDYCYDVRIICPCFGLTVRPVAEP